MAGVWAGGGWLVPAAGRPRTRTHMQPPPPPPPTHTQSGSLAAMADIWGAGEHVQCVHPGAGCIAGRQAVSGGRDAPPPCTRGGGADLGAMRVCAPSLFSPSHPHDAHLRAASTWPHLSPHPSPGAGELEAGAGHREAEGGAGGRAHLRLGDVRGGGGGRRGGGRTGKGGGETRGGQEGGGGAPIILLAPGVRLALVRGPAPNVPDRCPPPPPPPPPPFPPP